MNPEEQINEEAFEALAENAEAAEEEPTDG